MSDQITKMHSQQFTTNVGLLVMQKQSRLRTAVLSNTYEGKAAQIIQQVGSIELQPWVRGADTPIINTPHDVRWLDPKTKHGGQLIDRADFLRMIANPTNAYVQTATAAANRAIDNEIITQFFGTAVSGEDRSVTQTWDAFTAANPTHLVDSTGAANMTVAKLRSAKKAILAENTDIMSEFFCVINASMHDSLLAETLVVSRDYNGERPILVDGRIDRFMGFTFIITELIPSRASLKHSAMAFAKPGLAVGIFKEASNGASGEVTTRIDEIPGKAYATQVYTSVTVGASRVEEKQCAEIVCAD